MKKVLIVIHDMRIGGAQKSLVSFLQCLTASQMGKEYEISLMVIDPNGPFLKQIPESVKLISPPKPLRWLGSAFGKELLLHHFSFGSLWGECCWLIRKKLKRLPKAYNLQQKLWHSWKSRIPVNRKEYDVAISYIDGVPNYYVVEKVLAKKKVLWVHNEYEKLGYCPDYDKSYYEQADGIVTISEKCRQSLIQAFPAQQEQVHILENISSASDIIGKSRQGECPEFADSTGVKLLSVGRLNPQKGYDLAISAAKLLQEQGVDFLWLVLGDGPDREVLQQKIDDCGLQSRFRLLGSRENPYTYMQCCDLLVQSSRFEGKSVVLDEARVLSKAAVVTNYATVRDSVEHGKTGWITEMTPEDLAEGILLLCRDKALRADIEEYLQNLPKGNEAELHQYLRIMM